MWDSSCKGRSGYLRSLLFWKRLFFGRVFIWSGAEILVRGSLCTLTECFILGSAISSSTLGDLVVVEVNFGDASSIAFSDTVIESARLSCWARLCSALCTGFPAVSVE